VKTDRIYGIHWLTRKNMIQSTVPAEWARRFYDWLGARHDLGERFERRAKARALRRLELAPGQRVLNVGVGTGKEQAQIEKALAPESIPYGVDISPVMLDLTRARSSRSRLCQADVHHLPFASRRFHRLFSSYVLDLMPASDLPLLLAEFHRVLQPGGRLVLVSMTEGVDWSSRILMALWKAAYTIHPLACGGCRPVQLSQLVQTAGFQPVEREVVVQLGFPSEILVATRPQDTVD
jgi:demethylmenaquinone methyltransferase/2-methoxy-6-polyprenyl-1,4-benzoquinol methylase